MTATPQMPAVFIGHGSPMNTLQTNRYTTGWRTLGERLPRPRAVLVVSAHWYVGATAVTAMPQPRTIHDFSGFPPRLRAFEYPAPGAPDVAQEVIEAVRPVSCVPDSDAWGLDHGAWSVLAHLFPKADIPVLQLSIDRTQPPAFHLELGRRLAPLRSRGVLVLASGNVVHNLREVDFAQPGVGAPWAQRFDEATRAVMTQAPADVLRLMHHPDYARAAPTPEHFLPLLTLAGLSVEAGASPSVWLEGYDFSSLSMTSFCLGTEPGATVR